MADFLTRLTERNSGSIPVAQPVIAPMFAQGLTLANDSALDSVESTQVLGEDDIAANDSDDVQAVSDSAETLPSTSQLLVPQRDPNSAVPEQPFQVKRSEDSAQRNERSEIPPSGEIASEHAAESAASAPVEADGVPLMHGQDNQARSPSLHDNLTPALRSEQMRDDDQKPVREITRVGSQQDTPEIQPSTEPSARLTEPDDQVVATPTSSPVDVTPQTPIPEAFPLVRMQSERQRVDAHSQSGDESVRETLEGRLFALEQNRLRPEQTEPRKTELETALSTTSVRVTIGRVEVKATTPPRSARDFKEPAPRRITPDRPSSVLTLDEYLKRRNEELS